MKRYRMKQSVRLLGTQLRLEKLQRVILTPATNLPIDSDCKFFGRPLRGIWPDGMRRNLHDSIALTPDEVEVI